MNWNRIAMDATIDAAQHGVEPNADTAPKTGRTRKPSTRKAGASCKTRVG
jgi:hypothetical protein